MIVCLSPIHQEVSTMQKSKCSRRFIMNNTNILSSEKLLSLDQEAREACELIEKTYKSFGINQERIEVYRDEIGYEELSYYGVWYAHYPNNNYSLKCLPEFVFKVFRDEYLVKNGYTPEYSHNKLTEEGEKARVCTYFRRFLNITRERFNRSIK